MEHPVVLVHGWGGSYETTWRQSGFADLLEDAGRNVIGVDLLGHGTAPKPHDPDAYRDLTERVLDAAPDAPSDFVGFSLGAMTVLRLAVDHPDRVRSLVLAGIGRNVLESSDSASHRMIVAALQADEPESGSLDDGEVGPTSNIARLFVQYANGPENDRRALTAVLECGRAAFTPEELARVTCPVLVVIGADDFAGPGDPLAALLPNARLITLPRVDHFATPENFGFFDAALDFLGAGL
ncbi:MAG: alpha/beta fold hydrolase [Actinomycetota bacterium]